MRIFCNKNVEHALINQHCHLFINQWHFKPQLLDVLLALLLYIVQHLSQTHHDRNLIFIFTGILMLT